MNKINLYIIVIVVGAAGLLLTLYGCEQKWFVGAQGKRMIIVPEINQPQDIAQLFAQTPEHIQQLVDEGISQAQRDINTIIAIPNDQRTFDNTMRALDTLTSRSLFALAGSSVSVLELVSPRQEIREAAHAAIVKLQEFAIDELSNNVRLYQAVKAYAQGSALQENLTPEERYFLQLTLEDFKRAGLDLPADKLAEVKRLQKELTTLSLNFETNIAKDASTITVDRAGLADLEEEFINSLKRADDGTYILGVDYPTYFTVKDFCTVADTRKRLDNAFNNRAWPKNDEILRTVIAKRDELAKLLGFDSYAALDLDDEMAKKPATIDTFLSELYTKSSIKAEQEFKRLLTDLPPSVELTADGKMQPWDTSFAKEYYKKKHFAIDEQEVAQYFPMEKTVKGLLEIYKKFFSLDFKEVKVNGLWHDDLTVIEAHNAKDGQLLGYLILDLYPRANKFSHACQAGVLPAIKDRNGKVHPSVSVVIANFPPSTATRPSLLKRKDVETFFHEFGHAMHHLLGQTELGSFSGTHVKRDFVELPSQMLEEWLWDKDILKSVSSHYKTGEQLPDELIEKLIELKKFASGNDILRQCLLAQLSLDYYKAGSSKDTTGMLKDLYKRMITFIALSDENHFQASFGHLMDYGAKYYGYLWSRVFALDLFEAIKKEGLLNPVVGDRYVKEVIGRGGSAEPMELLKNFLGRAPNQEAFLKDLGL